MGLRARLAFMEVSPEQEEGWVKEWRHGLRKTVESLKVQLQVQDRNSSVSFTGSLSHFPSLLCEGLAVHTPINVSGTSLLRFWWFWIRRVPENTASRRRQG